MPASSTPSPVPVIVNTMAGTGCAPATLQSIERCFAAAGIEVRLLRARSGLELWERVQEAIRMRPALVVAAGGDGTLGAAAHAARACGATLGVIPLGTLNHFAKDAGIPLDVAQAVAVIARGEARDMDVGEVNGRAFLNNSSLGLYPVIVRRRTLQQRRLGRRKYPAMLWAMISVLRRSPFLRLKLQLDDREHFCRTPFVFVGNNDYHMEGFRIGTRTRLNCGHLSVYTTRRRTRWGLLGLGVRALFGRLHQADDFEARNARTLRVESSRRRLRVAMDGEVSFMETPLEIRIVPGGLRVMLPASGA